MLCVKGFLLFWSQYFIFPKSLCFLLFPLVTSQISQVYLYQVVGLEEQKLGTLRWEAGLGTSVKDELVSGGRCANTYHTGQCIESVLVFLSVYNKVSETA